MTGPTQDNMSAVAGLENGIRDALDGLNKPENQEMVKEVFDRHQGATFHEHGVDMAVIPTDKNTPLTAEATNAVALAVFIVAQILAFPDYYLLLHHNYLWAAICLGLTVLSCLLVISFPKP